MKSQHVFRGIGIVNVACGVLLGVGIVVACIGLASEPHDRWLLPAAGLAIVAVIAGALVHAAVRHLRQPSRQTALALAANTSVIIWLGAGTALHATNLRWVAGPTAGTLVALVLAFLAYRFYLRPVALRTYGSQTNAT